MGADLDREVKDLGNSSSGLDTATKGAGIDALDGHIGMVRVEVLFCMVMGMDKASSCQGRIMPGM